jgi:hypothetical protein
MNMKSQKPTDQDKQLKKLLESYTEVARHKLGRTPSLEDLTKMLNEDSKEDIPGDNPVASPISYQSVGGSVMDAQSTTTPKQSPQEVKSEDMEKAEDFVPEICKMKVYFGMSDKDGKRESDPNNILYYETPSGTFYDTQSDTWHDTKPDMVNHLPSRSVNFNEKDIVAAITHGVMGDEDYEALDKAGMIDHTPRRLWELTKKLRMQWEDLEKVDELAKSHSEGEPHSEPDGDEDEYGNEIGDVEPEHEENEEEYEYEGADVESIDEIDPFALPVPEPDYPGEDVLAELFAEAFRVVSTSPQLEESIREIVRQELQKLGFGQ